jgi:hypothetical protein
MYGSEGDRMKQISARAFRVAFPKLTEPVTVSTRGEAGEIRILGTWTPASVVAVGVFGDAAALARAGVAPRAVIDLGPSPIRPVPKPSARHRS